MDQESPSRDAAKPVSMPAQVPARDHEDSDLKSGSFSCPWYNSYS